VINYFFDKEGFMSNLTISVDDELIRQARIKAIEQGTSVSAKVREFLTQYARGNEPTAPHAPSALPVFDGGSGMQPGIDPLSNKSLLQAAEE
jgi:plasmid stability protein